MLGSALVKALQDKEYTHIITRTRNELDLTDQNAVDRFFSETKPEYIFLAAGLTGGIIANKSYPAEFLHVNISIQDNMFEATQKYDIKHLIFYGSSCMYPKLSPQPMKEKYFLTGPIEETSEAYGLAKMAGVMACKAYNKQYDTNRFIAIIPNSMYGPNDNFDLDKSHVLSALIRKFHEAKVRHEQGNQEPVVLWGSGEPRREFIFVDDAADASIFIMNNPQNLENHHYNIGSGRDDSIKELAETIASIVGYTGSVTWDKTKPDGSPRKLLDSSQFLSLGWQPKTTLEEGLRITYDWFLKNSPTDKL